MAIGKEEIPDPTTAGDFCRRFYLGNVHQMNKAFGEVHKNVYAHRKELSAWTKDRDAKVHEGIRENKKEAQKSCNGVYSLQPLYAFIDKTDEMIHAELRSSSTHPGAKAVAFLRRMKKKIPEGIKNIYVRSDSAWYNKEVIAHCKKEGGSSV